MITGRGPGAPGVTPGLKFTRRPVASGGVDGEAVDLSEIRRSEEMLDLLTAKRAAGRGMRRAPATGRQSALRRAPATGPDSALGRDPAFLLLSALAADVDDGIGDVGPEVPAAPAVAPVAPPASVPALVPSRAGAGDAGLVAGVSAAVPQARVAAEQASASAWLRAAAAVAVAASIAGTTSIVAASILARFAGGPSGRGLAPGRGWPDRSSRARAPRPSRRPR